MTLTVSGDGIAGECWPREQVVRAALLVQVKCVMTAKGSDSYLDRIVIFSNVNMAYLTHQRTSQHE
jgi:hypothetical protein